MAEYKEAIGLTKVTTQKLECIFELINTTRMYAISIIMKEVHKNYWNMSCCFMHRHHRQFNMAVRRIRLIGGQFSADDDERSCRRWEPLFKL